MPTDTPTAAPTATATIGLPLPDVVPLTDFARTTQHYAADIVCVWSSVDSDGQPVVSFPHKAVVALLAAWHLGAVKDLGHDRLTIRWDLFHVYQHDVSLLPLQRYHVRRHGVKVPTALHPGTWRLRDAPAFAGLPPGWYSLIARGLLYGPHCPKQGCAGQVRQTRFYMH